MIILSISFKIFIIKFIKINKKLIFNYVFILIYVIQNMTIDKFKLLIKI